MVYDSGSYEYELYDYFLGLSFFQNGMATLEQDGARSNLLTSLSDALCRALSDSTFNFATVS